MQPILRDPLATETLITHLLSHLFTTTIPSNSNAKIDVVVGLDARGFLLGPLIASRLGAAFVPVRKRGKLPGDCKVVSYEKEYGVVSQMRMDAVTGKTKRGDVMMYRMNSRCTPMPSSPARTLS